MRRGFRRRKPVWVNPLLMALLALALIKWLFFGPDISADKAVDEFYQYEQEGNFSQSWEMFHPYMKEKFSKGHYLQDRAHVFFNHFGVETFEYMLGEPEKVENWQPADEGPELEVVYKVPVTQVYEGKYGNFILIQDVYAVKDEEEWLILWDYNR
ncbi:hypothetical protein ACFSCZ_16200 [Siminovitchia sediminis]|uniref:Uncharacterized protein n=1 Tax=Siminovitchia sediminis TaxID=1274353 RepID=A0ABW4KKK9_9BACI